jgi:hypothetical protein
MYQSQKPAKDEAYKRFVRRLFCLACGATFGIEAAHTGPHEELKSCGPSSFHQPKGFWPLSNMLGTPKKRPGPR